MYVYVCICIYVCVYMYMYVFICIYVCVYMYMYICIYVYMYMYICIYVCVYMYMYMYICIYVYVYMYICIYVYMYICICIYVYVYMYVYICIYVCVYMYMYICIYVCVYMYMYICIYVYMYMYADIFLQWLLFKKIKPKLKEWSLIEFWKRFIDDGIGLWTGAADEFHDFIKALNNESKTFGIHFPLKEVQFGKSVNFLDLTIYLDEQNKIHHKLYIKPIDARTYLNPGSFHPPHIFASIPFSQMIRVIKRNTKEESCKYDLELLKNDLIKSGYKEEHVESIKSKAFERVNVP